jgi:hypothetical protein
LFMLDLSVHIFLSSMYLISHNKIKHGRVSQVCFFIWYTWL